MGKKVFAIKSSRGGYVRRDFTSETGEHTTRNAKSAYTRKDRKLVEFHLEQAQYFMDMRRHDLKIVEVELD